MITYLENAKDICNIILPIIGVIALIVLIILFIETIKAVKSVNKVFKKTNGTVDLVDESLKKVQAPLDSAVKVAHTVDVVHDATIKGVEDAKEFVSKNAEILKEKINELSKKQEELESKVADQEDIGGEEQL